MTSCLRNERSPCLRVHTYFILLKGLALSKSGEAACKFFVMLFSKLFAVGALLATNLAQTNVASQISEIPPCTVSIQYSIQSEQYY